MTLGTFGSVVQTRFGSYSLAPPGSGPVAQHSSIRSEPTQMASLITRTRRLALTIGPLVAIALTLAAGHRW